MMMMYYNRDVCKYMAEARINRLRKSVWRIFLKPQK